jgi:hypothetical protein
MDLENIWQQTNGGDKDLQRLLETGDPAKLSSRLPLKKLRNNLLIGLVWAVLITAGYVALFFFFPFWQVHVALGVVSIFNTLTMFDSWRLYKKTPDTITPSHSLKEELTKHYNSFQRWWRIQEKMGLFVYPIAASGGFILGGVIGSGKTVEAFLYNPKMLLILGITLLFLVPFVLLYGKMDVQLHLWQTPEKT